MPSILWRSNAIALFALLAVGARAAGPVYVRETGTAVALGNDFLERTISTAEGSVGTIGLLNKITGRSYAMGGSEFELRLIYERVGYAFGDENPMVVTAAGLRVASHRVEPLAGGSKRLVLRLEPGSGWTRHWIAIDLYYELRPEDFYMRQWLRVVRPGEGSYFVDWVSVARNHWGLTAFSLGGFGQPLFSEELFLGLEYPTGIDTAENGETKLGRYVGLAVPAEGYTSDTAVMGVAPAGAVHRQFLEYVKRMRVAPVRPFLLYNTWYDLQSQAMNHANTLERVPRLAKLLQPYGLHLDSFVLDDGWDDLNHLWAIDAQRFPGGFVDLAQALAGIGSHLGIWFGPIGGYNRRTVRLATAKTEGMEITSNGQYLCIAGRNYSRLLAETMLRYQKQYGLNYFKLDGIPFGCNDPDHGHPTGIYSREADARTFIDMLERLRAQDPGVFLNITTSIWLSPWWLRYADTVWMGGEDSGYLAPVPALEPRQSAVSYRDAVLYQDFVAHQAQFPISSLMTHGIIKGQYNMLGGARESLDSFRDEVVHYYTIGTMMYELYISPDILSAGEMDALGNTTRWAIANAHPLLDNSTMVLGDPAGREPYGYMHASAAKSIVMLRNPFVRPRTVRLKLDDSTGFASIQGPLEAEILYPYREMREGTLSHGDTLTFELGGYEEVVCELRPAAGQRLRITGARYGIVQAANGSAEVRVYAPEGATRTVAVEGAAQEMHFGQAKAPSELAFSAATATDTGAVTLAVTIPEDYREAKLAFLIEPERPIKSMAVDARDNGQPLALSTENGGGEAWHWFWANLPPGRHNLEVNFRLPAAAGGAHLSGWLITQRALAWHTVPLGSARPEPNLLPASTEVERHTYALIETSIR
jgi:hypothetical protein